MKNEFREYLDDIEMPGPMIERVERFHDLYVDLLPAEPTHIFVTDLIQEDGSRSYGSLWFFNAAQAMEAHRFVTEEAFDQGRVAHIDYWKVDREEYEVGNATDDSRLKVTFSSESISGTLGATGKNCEHLWSLFKDWVVRKSTI